MGLNRTVVLHNPPQGPMVVLIVSEISKSFKVPNLQWRVLDPVSGPERNPFQSSSERSRNSTHLSHYSSLDGGTPTRDRDPEPRVCSDLRPPEWTSSQYGSLKPRVFELK